MTTALEGALLDLGEVTLDKIVPGCPDDRVRSALDKEYEAWLPSRERHAPGSRPQPQQTKAQDRPRVRRRTQYPWVQREYTNNRSCCAQDVISGAWQDPQTTLPMGTQEPFWRSLFVQASIPDNRSAQPVGPPKWQLMVPITTEDVNRSLKGMKDGAPGPDGQKLKDVRAIPHDQLAAHFNLWLLSAYLPSTLRGGETVLLPKVSGAGAPNEFRPITVSNIVVRCFHRIMAQRMEMHLPLSLGQKAFRRGDGIADSVWFMQTVIKHHQDTLCPLNIAFMDVKGGLRLCILPIYLGRGRSLRGSTAFPDLSA